jgi:para-aminobenzoate synthetase component 2
VIEHSGRGLFERLPARLSAARYHSLVIDESTLPAGLVVEATIAGDPSLVMAVRHASLPAFGVQFHPESFLTPWGRDLAAAFLEARP